MVSKIVDVQSFFLYFFFFWLEIYFLSKCFIINILHFLILYFQLYVTQPASQLYGDVCRISGKKENLVNQALPLILNASCSGHSLANTVYFLGFFDFDII